MTQRGDPEPVGGLGVAAAEGGSVKSRRLGQICVGANKPRQELIVLEGAVVLVEGLAQMPVGGVQ
jgi:hypothetical protein